MNLACHIRHIRQLDRLAAVPTHLMTFYAADGSEQAPQEADHSIGPCTRIYVGDEFCVARMPSLPGLQRFAESASATGVALSLLTPVMTDADIPRIAPLFNYLNECHPGAEVVFNDWGVMGWLRSDYPALTLSAGRVLNKGFKDPRLKPAPASAEDAQGRPDALLNWSTFDGRWIQEHLLALEIDRFEQDLLPFQTNAHHRDTAFQTAIYFPFGYVTSGRTCWIASFDQPAKEQFIPPARCSRPCNLSMLELKSDKFGLRIFQSGNTIFYLYPRQRLDHLLQTARQNGTRLIYQGFGVDAS
jgi:hypothetical protein